MAVYFLLVLSIERQRHFPAESHSETFASATPAEGGPFKNNGFPTQFFHLGKNVRVCTSHTSYTSKKKKKKSMQKKEINVIKKSVQQGQNTF